MLTFEDKQVRQNIIIFNFLFSPLTAHQVQGAEAIVQTLTSLSFRTVRHVVKTVDAQPTVGNGVIVFVSGDLFVDGENNPIKFSQVFNLQPNNGSFYVLVSVYHHFGHYDFVCSRTTCQSQNELMRLNYS